MNMLRFIEIMRKYLEKINSLKLKNSFERLKENLRLYKRFQILKLFFDDWKLFMNNNKIKKKFFSIWREEMKILRDIIMVCLHVCIFILPYIHTCIYI
jgi:hypothetical protein